jgi:uncharacterized protein DUF4410
MRTSLAENDADRNATRLTRTLLLLPGGMGAGYALYKGGVLAVCLLALLGLLLKRKRAPLTGAETRNALRVLPLVLLVAWISGGCATSPGGVSAIAPLKQGVNLSTYSSLAVEVEGVLLTPADKERIRLRIVDAIRKEDATRFKDINSPTPLPSTLRTSVTVTNYEKGNTFARFMLAGLGQIHIDAQVALRDQDTGDVLGRFEVNKTFAWGGIYGAVTRIEDVEDGFAAAVANLLLGRDESVTASAQPEPVRPPDRAHPAPPELAGLVGVWRGRAEFKTPPGSVPVTLRIYTEGGALRWTLTRPRVVGTAQMTASGAGDVAGNQVTLTGRYDARSEPIPNIPVSYSLSLNGTTLTGSGLGADNIVHALSLERASSE